MIVMNNYFSSVNTIVIKIEEWFDNESVGLEIQGPQCRFMDI